MQKEDNIWCTILPSFIFKNLYDNYSNNVIIIFGHLLVLANLFEERYQFCDVGQVCAV
jgi:hypothetical protein